MTKPETKEPPRAPLISLGAALLNVALSGRARGVPLAGTYLFVVGDSASGKTWITLGLLAEALRTKAYRKHRLIYDDVENGVLMDVARCFGEALAERIEPPALDDQGEPRYSSTIEDFYFSVDDALKGPPFIYVCDSMDSLLSEAEEAKFAKDKTAHRRGKAGSGSYGDGKAKKNSTMLRRLVSKLRAHGSVLVVISQTRDNINAMPFQDPKTRAGGRALRFYAHAEIWTSVGKAIKKEIRGKARTVGNEIVIKVKKNRFTGRLSTITLPMFPAYGVDDLGGCVDYLVAESWAKKTKGQIAIDETHRLSGTREQIVRKCEGSPELTKVLHLEVQRCWRSIEQESAPVRAPRYS